MRTRRTVGRRLVTQNLIVSALHAETAFRPTWASVRDLAALIDIFCLYDRIEILGREVNSALLQDSRVADLLKTSDVLDICFPGQHSSTLAIAESAKRHLLTYLSMEDLGDFDGLVESAMSPREAEYGLVQVPDGVSELRQGDAWLRSAPRRKDLLEQLRGEEDLSRGITFLVRSFLYLAYADVTDVSLVPDATRSGVLSSVAAAELKLRDQLMQGMAEATSQSFWSSERASRVSPLASVVFERSGERKHLARELASLREELAPMRARLKVTEQKAWHGKGKEVVDAKADLKLITDELVRSYGKEPHLVSLSQVLSFGKALGDVADGPTKSKAWATFLLGLPFDIVQRLFSRRPVIELHELREEVPGEGRLRNLIRQIFGDPED